MATLSFNLTAVQLSALAWAVRLPEGILVRTQACAYTATMRRLEECRLVEVVERDQRGDPLRATATELGRRVAADLGFSDEVDA